MIHLGNNRNFKATVAPTSQELSSRPRFWLRFDSLLRLSSVSFHGRPEGWAVGLFCESWNKAKNRLCRLLAVSLKENWR